MKIRRIIFISVLTLIIFFGSSYYQQRKVEAVAPIVAYVAISALIHFAVGAYLYFSNGTSTDVSEITGINSSTGELTIELANTSVNYGIFTGNGKVCYPKSIIASTYPTVTDWIGWSAVPKVSGTLEEAITQECFNHPDNPAFCGYSEYDLNNWKVDRWGQNTNGPIFLNGDPESETLSYDPNAGLGGVYTGSINGNEVELYDFIDDVPLLPDCFDGIQNQDETGIDCGGVCEFNFGIVCPPAPETCFDGIQNQDETGVDCGGICETNYGLVCPAVETCSDGIMNQDETGVDFGGVCGTGNPVTPTPGNFIDNNLDGIEDITGLDASGNIPIAVPGTGDSSTYDASLPGDVSEFGETDWGTLITDFVSQNPLVLLATNSSINTSNESCLLTFSLWGKAMEIDFCSIEWMVNLFGTFVLGLMTIRSIFIAMGI